MQAQRATNEGVYQDNNRDGADINNMQSAFGRPKTAGFMPEVINGANRPQTGALKQPNGGRLPAKNSLKRFTPVGAGATRAVSAGFSQN